MSEVALVIEPRKDVVTDRHVWWCPHLRLGIPAPPGIISQTSVAADMRLAAHALNHGFASARWSRSAPSLAVIHAYSRIGLRPARSALLPCQGSRAVGVTLALCLRAVAGPLALLAICATAGWLVPLAPLTVVGTVGMALIGSVVVHEAGHVLALRLGRSHVPAVLVAMTLSPHVVRPRLNRRRDVLVTVAGPLAPTALTLAAAPGIVRSTTALVAMSIISLAHVLALVLPTADRRALRAALRDAEDDLEEPPKARTE